MKLVRGKQFGYKGLRTFEVVFVEGKGFKWVNQIKSLRTGEWFSPKETIYCPFMVQYIDVDGSNRIFSIALDSIRSVDEVVNFFRENDFEFTPEESKYIWLQVISLIRSLAMKINSSNNLRADTFLKRAKIREMIELFESGEPINSIVNIGFDSKEIAGGK